MKVSGVQLAQPVVRPVEKPTTREVAGPETPKVERSVRSTPAAAGVTRPAQVEPDTTEFAEALRKAAEVGGLGDANLSVSVDKSTGRIIVRLVDPESGEVTRQIPPDEVLQLARSLHALRTGFLVNTKA